MMRVGTTAKMMAFVTRAPYNGNTAALVRYRTGLRMMSAAPPSAKVSRMFASLLSRFSATNNFLSLNGFFVLPLVQ
jgi:hypothetical protein